MVKALAIGLGTVILLGIGVHFAWPWLHGGAALDGHLASGLHGGNLHGDVMEEGTALSISMAQNDDFDLCNDAFFLGIFGVIKDTYAVGAENVQVAMLEEKIFTFVRTWPEFSREEAEGWVEHIKIIPGQFVEIARESPEAAQNCEDFSIAMVGPP